MTREQALNLKHGDTVHFGNCSRTTGKRGGVKESTMACRVTGKVQTWVRSPKRYRVPVKHGLYNSGEIAPENVSQYHLPADCPLNDDRPNVSAQETHIARVQLVTAPILGDMQFFRVVCSCGFTTPEQGPGERGNDAAARMLRQHVAGQQ